MAALSLSTLPFFPIVHNYFHAEDFVDLYRIVNYPLPQFLLTPRGGHVYLARNAVFVLSHRAFDTDAQYYFWTVLVTHVLNVGLLFSVIRLLTGSPGLACLGATLWGSSPVNEGSLGWYAVFGHVLAGTVLLLVLRGVARIHATGLPLSRRATWLWSILLLAGTTCFGVGLAVALAFPVVAWLLLPASRDPESLRRRFWLLPVLAVALYASLQGLHGALYGRPQRSIALLAGALEELPSALTMLFHMIASGLAGLVLGPFYSPAGYPNRIDYALLVLYTLGVGVTLALRRSAARPLLAVLLLALAGYAAVAAGRTSMALLWGYKLEVAASMTRYHYVAPLCLCIGLCLILQGAEAWPLVRTRATTALLWAWLAATAVLLWHRGPVIDHHAEARAETSRTVQAIREAIAARRPGEEVTIENQPFISVGLFNLQIPASFPGWAALFTIFFPADTVDGRRVWFVERNPRVLDAVIPGSRLAGLLLDPNAAAR